MLLVGDTVGLYVGPQSTLQAGCGRSPVNDFTVFAVDKEPPYIRDTRNVTGKWREG